MNAVENVLLGVNSLEELLRFANSFQVRDQPTRTHEILNEADVTKILRLCEALWIHSGDPSMPHAELTSGKCSNGFVNVLAALRYANICDVLAYTMAHGIKNKIREIEEHEDALTRVARPLGWIVGSDHAGAVFSHDVARWLAVKQDFTEKNPHNEKEQLWKRFSISPDQSVLQVEELMTTAGTLLAVRDGIRVGNPHPVTFSPVVGVLVHRSDVYEIEGSPVVYLAHYDISVWDPSDCPLCAAGSKRLRPKKNWAELTGKI